jgi:hypothetical protein
MYARYFVEPDTGALVTYLQPPTAVSMQARVIYLVEDSAMVGLVVAMAFTAFFAGVYVALGARDSMQQRMANKIFRFYHAAKFSCVRACAPAPWPCVALRGVAFRGIPLPGVALCCVALGAACDVQSGEETQRDKERESAR